MSMMAGFNIIEKRDFNDEILKIKFSFINFLRKIYKKEKLPIAFAVEGLEDILFCADSYEQVSSYINKLLRDRASFLSKKLYVIQIIISGSLKIFESSDRPRIEYKNKYFQIHDIFGRVYSIDSNHFRAPLNIQS